MADANDASVLSLQSGKVLPAAQLTILGLGVRPDTKVIHKFSTEVTVCIIVDQMLHCAVGDAVEICNLIFEGKTWTVPLAGPANCQGRMLADNILHPSYQQKNTHEH